MPRPYIIVVDGIIGCGKTTLVRKYLIPKLRDMGYKVVEVEEPVEDWKKSGHLELFYQNPARRSFQFQIHAFHSRVRKAQEIWHQHANIADILVLERSIFTDLIFARVLHQQNQMDDTELADYIDLHRMWSEVMPFIPDLFLYLRPSVQLCMQRLHLRNRVGENNISIKYQELLMYEHDQMFKSVTINNKLVDSLILEKDYINDAHAQAELWYELSKYLPRVV